MADTDIIHSILSGNRNDYRLLVEKYQQMIFRTCMGFVHNKEDANELTQDVFVKAYQHLSSFKKESAFSTWLYRITVNASLNFLRSKKKSFLQLDTLFGQDKSGEISITATNMDNPEQILISEEQKQIIRDKLDELPEKQKTAFVLSKYDNLRQKEIAKIMNITEGAVESLIHRAKANLQMKLAAYFKKFTLQP